MSSRGESASLTEIKLATYAQAIVGESIDAKSGRADPAPLGDSRLNEPSQIAGLVIGQHAICLLRADMGVGAAMLWARTRSATRLDIVVEDRAGHLARRAALVSSDIGVWEAAGADVAPAEAIELHPVPGLRSDVLAFSDVIVAAGADPVDNFGRLVAEVDGLEVARVEVDPVTDEPLLHVGVGQADRELTALISAETDPTTRLASAVGEVRRHRHRGSLHPLARLARQRWLRSAVCSDPALLGLESLHRVAPLSAVESVAGTESVAAVGSSLVVFSVGFNAEVALDALDFAYREASQSDKEDPANPGVPIVILAPSRDVALVRKVVDVTGGDDAVNVSTVSIDEPWERAKSR